MEIEEARKYGILLEHRICKLCEKQGITVIEDEHHLLLKCNAYSNLRQNYTHSAHIDNPTYAYFIRING